VDQKAILDAIDSGAIGGTATATTVTIDPAGSVDPNRIDVATLGADATGSDKATLNLEIALANAWSAQELLDFNIGTWNTETNKFDIYFQNYLANKNNESVFKVGIENAAYSLADLGAFLTTMESASDLKASEADIFMGAFSTNFVQIVRQGDYGVMETFAEMGLDNTHLDSASIRTALEVGRLRPDHRDAHAVLRGTQLETYEKPGEWFTQVAKASEANKEAQKNKLRQAQDKLEKLKDDL
jgi:hypothetical protein